MLKILKVFVALQIFAFGYAYSQTTKAEAWEELKKFGPECVRAIEYALPQIKGLVEAEHSRFDELAGITDISPKYCNHYKAQMIMAKLARNCANSGVKNGTSQSLIDEINRQAVEHEISAKEFLELFRANSSGGTCY